MSISIDATNIRLNAYGSSNGCLDIAQTDRLESMRFIV